MNTFDDPKLTAYALGELDETERVEVEKQIAADADARRFVEETRAFTAQLGAELKAEPQPDLTPEQKTEITAGTRNTGFQPVGKAGVSPASPPEGKIVKFPSRAMRWSLAAAALLALCAAFAALLLPELSARKDAAQTSEGQVFAANNGPLEKDAPRDQRISAASDSLASLPVPAASPPDVKIDSMGALASNLELERQRKNEIELASTVNATTRGRAAEETKLLAMQAPAVDEKLKDAEAQIESRLTNTFAKNSDTSGSDGAAADVAYGNKTAANAGSVTLGSSSLGVDEQAMGLAQNKPQSQRSESGSTESHERDNFGAELPTVTTAPASVPVNGLTIELASGIAGFNSGWSKGRGDDKTANLEPSAGPRQSSAAPVTDQPTGLSTDGFNTEAYDHVTDNPFLRAAQNPLSTFSIDVDTASYANVRRFLTSNTLPPKDAVRIEELVNYFTYDYPQPEGSDPFSVNTEVAPAPWNAAHQLARIGLKGRDIPAAERTAANLVFLLDVSGSMNEPNKLPLVQQSMKMLVERLRPDDRVAIVVYAGASGMALESTEVREKNKIIRAIEKLKSGGSTNGAAGIQLAYDIAKANFIKGSANRVILCTDGDFNVGTTSQGGLVRLITDKAKSGVFLTVLGFGMGNYKDGMLEKLADKGNGAYGYIDTAREAKKLFVDQLSGTLVTIAKDVKIQIEFNPARVGAYRLIGYENRLLRAEDFNNDKIDAGEIGSGHTVTALYELVPAGHENDVPGVDALKYGKSSVRTSQTSDEAVNASPEWMTVKLRYKQPDGDVSKLIERPVSPASGEVSATKDFQFAAAVAEFGMLLRESPHKGSSSFDTALELAENGMGADLQGYRHEFMDLVRKAKDLKP